MDMIDYGKIIFDIKPVNWLQPTIKSIYFWMIGVYSITS